MGYMENRMDQEAIIKEAIQEAFAPVVELETLKAKDYLSPDEVEKIFPLPVSTLEKLRKDGKGPKWIKRGRKVFYRPNDVRSYLNSHRQMTSEH